MKRSIAPPTKAEIARWELFDEFGCIACRRWKRRRLYAVPEKHHINDGGRNISHWHTLPLCVWHHRAIRPDHASDKEMVAEYGHSVAHGIPLFEADHGPQRYLWKVFQRFYGLDTWWPETKILHRRIA